MNKLDLSVQNATISVNHFIMIDICSGLTRWCCVPNHEMPSELHLLFHWDTLDLILEGFFS